MEVPLPLLSGGNQAQLNEHGSTSHVPVHRNVTGCRTVGWVGENVKSAVGTADAEPADPTSAAAVSRSAAGVGRRGVGPKGLWGHGGGLFYPARKKGPPPG